MRTRGRRRLDVVVVGLGALVGGGVVALGGAIGDAERVSQMWVGAEITAEGGSTRVVEVIDYDFGSSTGKHGIYRDVPGLSVESPVSVQSDGASANIADRSSVLTTGALGSRMKIGDPNVTVSGRHRYRIDYALPRGELLDGSDSLSWDAVGTAWEVPIGRAEVHLVAPWELVTGTCAAGGSGAAPGSGGCTLRQVAPGHLVAEVDGLRKGEGITVTARRGPAVSGGTPVLPAPPVSAPPDPGTGIALPAAAALITGLGSALTASALVRRSGRERVGTGGVADAAWAGAGGPTSEVRMDETDLAQMATTELAPPEGLTPAQGGVLHAEAVRPTAKVAWLIQAAIDGAIELVEAGGKAATIVKKGALATAEEAPLATAFAGRDQIQLGTYDPKFAAGWGAVGAQLEAWMKSCGLWDADADRRKTKVRGLGALATLGGAAAAFVGGYASSRWGGPWVALVVLGSLVSGGGFAALVRGWELRVRTPEGSGLWLRVESFRRFLHDSETFHAEEAAKRGVLREYTAWAVALGEIDRWSKAVAGSTTIPPESGLSYAHLAPVLMSSTSSTATAPSSSSSSGGGGSVGGGGGGGGGGSW